VNAHLAVFVGGAAGALARYGLVEAIPHDDPTAWPWATFIANIVGSVILGFLAAHFARRHPIRPLLATGFCGAFTTFSTFQFELTELDPGVAVLYAALSIAAGLAAVLAGRRVSWR
jgi:fluoride exporter